VDTAGQQRSRGWRTSQENRGRLQAVLAVLAVSAAMVLASCGGTDGGDASHPTTTTGSQPVTTSDPASTAVLQAYRASWAAFEKALASANAGDPELAATMVDPQLQGVKANLLADQHQGIVGQGTITLHPRITVLTATTATVVDCAYSTSELVYANTGKQVPPVTPPENDGVQATLVLSGATWKVSKQDVTDGKCAPGS
jgi:hypothetical protein